MDTTVWLYILEYFYAKNINQKREYICCNSDYVFRLVFENGHQRLLNIYIKNLNQKKKMFNNIYVFFINININKKLINIM